MVIIRCRGRARSKSTILSAASYMQVAATNSRSIQKTLLGRSSRRYRNCPCAVSRQSLLSRNQSKSRGASGRGRRTTARSQNSKAGPGSFGSSSPSTRCAKVGPSARQRSRPTIDREAGRPTSTKRFRVDSSGRRAQASAKERRIAKCSPEAVTRSAMGPVAIMRSCRFRPARADRAREDPSCRCRPPSQAENRTPVKRGPE